MILSPYGSYSWGQENLHENKNKYTQGFYRDYERSWGELPSVRDI